MRWICVVLALLVPGMAWAAGQCTINASMGPAFGVYDPQGANATAPLDASGLLTIECNPGAKQMEVSFGQGMYAASGSSCSFPLRQMGQGAHRMRYDLYRDAARSQVWGCTSATSEHRELSKNVPINNFIIYGRIPAGQNPAVGLFSDTISVDVSF